MIPREAYLDITTVYHFQKDWRLAILQSMYHFLLQQKPTHPSLGNFLWETDVAKNQFHLKTRKLFELNTLLCSKI